MVSEKNIVENTRNIGIMAHIDAGKTTTTERILFYSGITYKMGEVDDGSAEMDWMQQEKERGITITSAVTTCYWNNKKINIIDTPGHVDFTAEVERALRVLDGAIAIFCGVGGVECQSETVWRQSDNYDIPRIAYINKLDRIGSDCYRTIESIHKKLGAQTFIIQLPFGKENDFKGVIDLIRMKAVVWDEDNLGVKYKYTDIPEEYKKISKEYRIKLLEQIAEMDDELMEKYLETGNLSEEEIKKTIRHTTLKNHMVPVLCGSSYKNKGVQLLLDAVVDYLPSPLDVPPIKGFNPETKGEEERTANVDEPFSALVYKIMNDAYSGPMLFFRVYSGELFTGDTVYNATKSCQEKVSRLLKIHANKREEIKRVNAGDIAVATGFRQTTTGDTICNENHPVVFESIKFPDPVMSVAIEPKTKNDQDRLSSVLYKLCQEDPTFKLRIDEETGQHIISGMGELHLEILVDRMFREYKVNANVGKPQVAYKETISCSAKGEGKFIKQTGGRGQYGHVIISIEPLERGGGFRFENRITGDVIPKEFIPTIENALMEAMDTGILIGYPIVDLKASLIDGSFHEVDSSDLAFKIATSMAFRDAAKKAQMILLEPNMNIEILIPEEYLGDIIADINSRRGKIESMEQKRLGRVIKSKIPLSEMFGYSTQLRSMTQGRGTYSIEFSLYEEVPQQISQKILAKVYGK
ncbi:MAG: elongation factor G [bacterium]